MSTHSGPTLMTPSCPHPNSHHRPSPDRITRALPVSLFFRHGGHPVADRSTGGSEKRATSSTAPTGEGSDADAEGEDDNPSTSKKQRREDRVGQYSNAPPNLSPTSKRLHEREFPNAEAIFGVSTRTRSATGGAPKPPRGTGGSNRRGRRG